MTNKLEPFAGIAFVFAGIAFIFDGIDFVLNDSNYSVETSCGAANTKFALCHLLYI